MLQSNPPVDFILTDTDMPVMSGYEFLSHLKENYPDIPVLVMIGATASEYIHIKSLGFLNFVKKSFNVIDLVRLVMRIIEWQDMNVRRSIASL